MSPNSATQSQNRASDPNASTWLSANAGSGKTKVLTDRVARLLLDGVSPQNILCLTYTKAAASEMQNRLFKLLGKWAMKNEVDLRKDLRKLGVSGEIDLNAARKLFARAIETPGGLKIQTIHSFCAALLRRFPLEAGVPPQFVEMDDRSALLMRDDVVEDMALGPHRPALAGLAAFHSDQDFQALTSEICGNRSSFKSIPTQADVWSWFGLPPDFDEDTVAQETITPTDPDLIPDLIAALQHSPRSSDMTLAGILAQVAECDDLQTSLSLLNSGFLTKAGTIKKNLPTSGTMKALSDKTKDSLAALQARLEWALEQKKRLYSAQKTLALHKFAVPFLEIYDAKKLQKGWVDFDDLITKAGDLLSDPGLADWVLFRLDGGIDHILVDEAQDTSPDQWRVIRLLAQEFTSGQGARDIDRTIFVVGDPKQSIYSFQGADPSAFSEMRAYFSDSLSHVGKRLENRMLEHSFRSAPAILRFADIALRGLPGLDEGFNHRAFFTEKPGRVDLWPAVPAETFTENREWTDTTDTTIPLTHNLQLAQTIADEVARLISEERITPKDGETRRVQPGDILILVRGRRTDLFGEIIRACKTRSIPIAGADRLRIGGELAVKDLVALLRFLATPEDDLSLAASLKSPLFGFSEDDLFKLAHHRPDKSFLWQALRHADTEHPEAVAMLSDLRNSADFSRPFELLERILIRFDGRTNLLARLGQEAEDGIDALLNQALVYENSETPSLTGFLEWLDAMEVEIKRQMDSAGNQIRVMTIHGAKGLEAPIVILPDTAKKRARVQASLLKTESGDLAWKPLKEDLPKNLIQAANTIIESDEQERARLLYVAATRAENWLIVAAAGETGSDTESWYSIVQHGLEKAGAQKFQSPLGEGLRLQTGAWADPEIERRTAQQQDRAPLPDWARTKSPGPAHHPAPLSPSDLGGEKSLPGEGALLDSEDAKQQGTLLHRLLEVLPDHPQETWSKIASAVMGSESSEPNDALIETATALLKNPALSHIFAPGTLAEVAITANLASLGNQQIYGSIDRLLVTNTSVTIVDFKSNAVVPNRPENIPDGILRQMAAYMQAVQQVFPEHIVDCAILWTTNAELMPIPDHLLQSVLVSS
ncbi:MAG TPA: double-strand break repair helicase AddA [Aliiroseovarius sp.]|nr:double-strand break repair helicase AddA [Aliiroseovarius sp.]